MHSNACIPPLFRHVCKWSSADDLHFKNPLRMYSRCSTGSGNLQCSALLEGYPKCSFRNNMSWPADDSKAWNTKPSDSHVCTTTTHPYVQPSLAKAARLWIRHPHFSAECLRAVRLDRSVPTRRAVRLDGSSITIDLEHTKDPKMIATAVAPGFAATYCN